MRLNLISKSFSCKCGLLKSWTNLYIASACLMKSLVNKYSNDIICFSNLFKKGAIAFFNPASSTKTMHLNPSSTNENVLFVLPMAILA